MQRAGARPALPAFGDAAARELRPKRAREEDAASGPDGRRLRPPPAFAIEAGNWPTFVFVRASAPGQAAARAVARLTREHPRLADVDAISAPHVSLARPFALREHQIAGFADSLRRELDGQRPFGASCHGWRVFESENRARKFGAVMVQRGRRRMTGLLACVDRVLKSYGKATFFVNPELHVSLSCGVALPGSALPHEVAGGQASGDDDNERACDSKATKEATTRQATETEAGSDEAEGGGGADHAGWDAVERSGSVTDFASHNVDDAGGREAASNPGGSAAPLDAQVAAGVQLNNIDEGSAAPDSGAVEGELEWEFLVDCVCLCAGNREFHFMLG